jgi:hypothetical protein
VLRVRLPGVTAIGFTASGSAATSTSSSPAAASAATSASASPMRTLRRHRRWVCGATVARLGRRPKSSSCFCGKVLRVLGMGAASSSSCEAASAAISSTAATRPRREAAS